MIKDMQGKASVDNVQPGCFEVADPQNWVEGNVAAGSERMGFVYSGLPCSPSAAFRGSFANNVAHSCLVGLWLRASDDAAASGCTALANFTAYLNWDFGIIRWEVGCGELPAVCV